MRRASFACLILTLAACDGGADDPGADTPTPDAGADPGCGVRARTCAEVMATFTAQDSDVEVTCDEAAGTFTMTASGLPNYPSNQSTPNAVGVQGWVVTLPLAPACAAAPESVVSSRGPVGFMVNGVAFFGPQNANGQDAPSTEAATLDDCDGHADMQCVYHYHHDPSCVFGAGVSLADHTLPDGHAPVVGHAIDGVALHGPMDGITVDACNGHRDDTRGYHYHVTATSPYFVGCLVAERWDPIATDMGCD
jgi:hypothetical protein